MSNYLNGKIYKITDKNNTKCYYGSTTRELVVRFSEHKNSKKNCSINILFDEFGIDNCRIELVIDFVCDNRKDLEKMEGYYIKNNECVNKRIAGRNVKEQRKGYRNNNKEKIKEYQKEYYLLTKKKNN